VGLLLGESLPRPTDRDPLLQIGHFMDSPAALLSPAHWLGTFEHGSAIALDGSDAPQATIKYKDELQFWRNFCLSDCQRIHGASFAHVFGAWQRERINELAHSLSQQASPSFNFANWASTRTAIEFGPGPFPSIAVVDWKQAIAIDPLADGYVQEGLLPPECDHVVYLASQGERVPLPSGTADIIVMENCLDHVDDPFVVLQEAKRLLKNNGTGLLWLLVDLMTYSDDMHPHPFVEDSLRQLLADVGFHPLKDRVSDHHSHPRAFGEYRGLLALNKGVPIDTQP